MTISNIIGLVFLLGVFHLSSRHIHKSINQKLLIAIALLLVYALTVSAYAHTFTQFRSFMYEAHGINQSSSPLVRKLDITDYYSFILMIAFLINWGIAYRNNYFRISFVPLSIVVLVFSIVVLIFNLKSHGFHPDYYTLKPIIIFLVFSGLIILYTNRTIKQLFVSKLNSKNED